MTIKTAYVDNDNLIILPKVTNNITGKLVEGATVVAKIVDISDTVVVGGEAIGMSDAIEAGTYVGKIPASLALVANKTYKAEISLDGGGATANWLYPFRARTRY